MNSPITFRLAPVCHLTSVRRGTRRGIGYRRVDMYSYMSRGAPGSASSPRRHRPRSPDRRVDPRLIKETGTRGEAPASTYGSRSDASGKGGMSNHPGRPRAGTLAVARNDHVTPPSVYWQDAHAHSCGKERPWRPEQVAWASRAWKDRSRDTGQKSPDCKWSALVPGADIWSRYVCFEG